MNGTQESKKLESAQNVTVHIGINQLLISKGNKPRRGNIVKCGLCGKEIYVMQCLQREINYCSTKCYHASRKTGCELECYSCGKLFYRTKSMIIVQEKRGNKKHFCSKKCHGASIVGKYIGEKSSTWKGGRSRGYKTGYWSTEYQEWRKKVFERDCYTCQECGFSGYVEPHHIKGFTHFPELRYEIENGVTLCKKCHKTKHEEILKNRKERKLQKVESLSSGEELLLIEQKKNVNTQIAL